MIKREFGIYILLAVAIFAMALWFTRTPVIQELPAAIANAPPTGAGGNAPPTGAGEAFNYYPAQYSNQATEPSEHIQAY